MSKHPKPADGTPVHDRLGRKLAIALAIVTVIGLAPSAFLARLDFTAAAAPAPVVDDSGLDLSATPADTAVAAVLAQHPSSWTAAGAVVRSVLAPYPFSCADAGAGPAVAASQDFTTAAGRVQIVATAYTAGLGAEALERLRAAAPKCASTGTAISTAIAGAGAEAYSTAVTKGGSAGTVVSVRVGDVVAHASGSRALDAGVVAAELAASLSANVGPVCANVNAVAADGVRNPWSAKGYVPKTDSRTASIDDPGLPAVGVGATYMPTPIPEPDFALTPVVPNAVPAHPVWPEMPAVIALPAEPAAPAPQPLLSSTVAAAADDAEGPGCGWAFTGMTAPVFDAELAEKQAVVDVVLAEKKLTADAAVWQASVLAYWEAMAAFTPLATAYQAYADQVLATNAAWDAIAAAWSVYEADHSSWALNDAARTALIAEQTAARIAYDKALAECEAKPGEDALDCDDTVQRPAVLDRPVPVAVPEPLAPQDPRPTP